VADVVRSGAVIEAAEGVGAGPAAEGASEDVVGAVLSGLLGPVNVVFAVGLRRRAKTPSASLATRTRTRTRTAAAGQNTRILDGRGFVSIAPSVSVIALSTA
jgi:hypothetical protein